MTDPTPQEAVDEMLRRLRAKDKEIARLKEERDNWALRECATHKVACETIKAKDAEIVHWKANHDDQVRRKQCVQEINARLRAALEATQWGFNHARCPVCAGWAVGPYGETDFAHNEDCIVRKALEDGK